MRFVLSSSSHLPDFKRSAFVPASAELPVSHGIGQLVVDHWLLRRASESTDFKKHRLLLATLWERHGTIAARSATFHAYVGFLFLVVQHGWHALLIMAICMLAYFVTNLRTWSYTPRWLATGAVWGSSLAVLLFKESYRLQFSRGYTWLQVLPLILPLCPCPCR